MKNCWKLKPFARESVTPVQLRVGQYKADRNDNFPSEYRLSWELDNVLTGTHTRGLARTVEEAREFQGGIDNCTGPKRRRVKVGPVEIPLPWKSCQNPSLRKGK